MRPAVKICGITREEELPYLIEHKVTYAGFVLYPKSKRYVTLARACELKEKLPKTIQTMAVVVSPSVEEIKEIDQRGFSYIQVHGTVPSGNIQTPMIRAIPVLGVQQTKKEIQQGFTKYAGILLDGKEAGSGVRFSWEETAQALEEVLQTREQGKLFFLAGGLNTENVTRGIALFAPDVVDVSSGVEGTQGKEKAKIEAFTERIRKHEEIILW